MRCPDPEERPTLTRPVTTRLRCQECGRPMSYNRTTQPCPRCVGEAKDREKEEANAE
jgi:ribosomal protein L37E